MSEPNRLRDQSAPNSYPTGGVSDRPEAVGAPQTTRSTSTVRRRSNRGRRVIYGGLAIAVVGIPFFFGPGITSEEIGIGLICLGIGIAITTVSRRSILEAIAVARQSKLAAAGTAIFFAPHLLAMGAVGCGLIGFGLLLLALAFGVI
jgi:hypothetical protein